MELFQRVTIVANTMAGSRTNLAQALGVHVRTFSNYLKPARQNNLWPLLSKILESYPEVRRDWLYFGEDPMLHSEGERSGESRRPKRVSTELAYPDDALGRIAMLTNVRTSSALELQVVFGADFKDIKIFLSKCVQARQAREEWRAAGNDEEAMPSSPEIPDEWLHHFWMNFGPNPGWIQYGEREWGNAPLLREHPRDAELARLQNELTESRHECAALREQLARTDHAADAGWGKTTAPTPTVAHGDLTNG